MTDTYISSLHIQKLGHEILEIRERALQSIISKLNRGYTFDNDVARSRELLSKLFDWFLLEPCTCEAAVLQLIKRILTSETGRLLQKHYGGKIIKTELEKIKSFIEPQFHKHIEDILEDITDLPEVPPLVSSVPLSYRSDATANVYESTATPIEGNFSEKPSLEQLLGFEKTQTASERISPQIQKKCLLSSSCVLKWQSLISQDLHVLRSIENSFRNPPDPSGLLNSCEFYKEVILQDFPAEVFLQRPTIILLLQGLLKDCPSTRIAFAVLECLSKLTQLLIIRIHFYNDPSVHNNKKYSESRSGYSTPISEERRLNSENLYMQNFSARDQDFVKESEFEYWEMLASVRQLSVPKFCLSTMICLLEYICDKPTAFGDDRKKLYKKQNCVSCALRLLQEMINLLSLCLSKNMSKELPSDLTQDLNSFLHKFADTLEFFRIDLESNDCNPQQGIIYLCLLHVCMLFLEKIVPPEKGDVLLPMSFIIAVGNCLINPIVSRLYSDLHDFILDYLEKCETVAEIASLERYRRSKEVCVSMSAAVELLHYSKSKSFSENIALAKEAILSLQFHKNTKYLKIVVDVCAAKMPLQSSDDNINKDVTDVILPLLSHYMTEIRQEMYELCQKKVITAVGPKLNATREGAPGTQILFLLQPEILTEIALNGLTSEDQKIRSSAEAMLVYIIKCKILVSDDIWQRSIEALIPTLPILLCHADKSTPIGRTVSGILDPDVGKSLFLTDLEILKGNVELLFANDATIRNEAISRICWLLASQEGARDLLPKLSNLQDKALASVCQLRLVYDVNKNRNTQHYYEPTNLKQVLRLLQSEDVEPVIRRSALTQISVMVEDHLLHRTFFDADGLRVVLDTMKSALTEKNYRDYPDSVVPVVSILKQLCLYNASVRHELSSNFYVFCLVLRGLFMYFTEDHMREDCSVVLFLLLFNAHVRGCPSNGDLSLPALICDKIKVPFTSHVYATSDYSSDQAKLIDEIFSDSASLSVLQVHWTLEWFGGVDQILKWESVEGEHRRCDNFDERLLLTEYGLMLLKNCSLERCCKKYLMDVQNATTHVAVLDGIARLTGCVSLYTVIFQVNRSKCDGFYDLPWEKTFKKFLTVLPSGDADCTLLISVLKFLTLIVSLYRPPEASCWISLLMRSPKNCLFELLDTGSVAELQNSKTLARELLNLIVRCVQQEQNFLYSKAELTEESSSWSIVFKVIADSLKLSDTNHFYNLAFLDGVLDALVHVTGTMGWSSSNKQSSNLKDPIFHITADICELLSAFHCGKGTTATESVMGLSITRHLLLILNHLLAEMHSAEFKDWELCFLDDVTDDNNERALTILLQLWCSRDVLVRAAVLQLFAGLCVNPKIAVEIARETVNEKTCVWEAALSLLLDNEEASVVRENAAALLTNLCSHIFAGVNVQNDDSSDKIRIVLNLLEDYDFYKRLKTILSNLYVKSVTFCKYINNKEGYLSNSSSESSVRNDENRILVTPGVIKATARFICNLIVLSKEDVIYNLKENGLIKQFFRALSVPSVDCKTTKELALYRDILEMNTQLCVLLNRAVSNEKSCLSVLLHTRDCLGVLLSFLNPKLYHTYLPELVYLRNKLWNEVFSLLTVLASPETESQSSVSVITNCIGECYKEPFLQTLCEAISNQCSEELQQSALTSLISLLNVETCQSFEEEHSLPNLLDSFRTPRNLAVEKNLECIEPFNVKTSGSRKLRILENAYFEKRIPTSCLNSDSNDPGTLLAGAEVCKILLHLYHITTLNLNSSNFKKRSIVVSSLTSLLGVSKEAKTYAFVHGLLETSVQQLRELHIKLSLETVECMRRIMSRKRVSPLLRELDSLAGLLTNFMLGNAEIKDRCADLGLADLVHKLWVWFCFQKSELANALKLLCTFTVDSAAACQSMTLTSPIAGSGPRKSPSNVTLLHALISLINREMELISRTHDLIALKLSLEVLQNVCCAVECRLVLAKSNLFSTFTRLHPAITKRQKPWEHVELLWLEFLQAFTAFPEGQAAVAKIPEVLELIIILTTSSRAHNRKEAVYVLRNVSFYQPNRPRLLMSNEFLHTLCAKLENGTKEERNAIVSILWVLAANNQKAKLSLKCARLDVKLQECLKQCHVLGESNIDPCDVKRMHLVLNLLRDNDK